MKPAGLAALIVLCFCVPVIAVAQDNPAANTAVPAASATPPPASAPEKKPEPAYGLYEVVTGDTVRWIPYGMWDKPAVRPMSEMLLTPAFEKKLVSPYFEPIVMLRSTYVTTREDSWVDERGRERSSTELRRTFFGHREGFVLENMEIGVRGRVNNVGIHYGLLLEAVPREKDGTKSEGDYLKEVWVGWNKYSVFDVKVGRIKVPISQANLKSTHDQPLVYKPLLDTLLPKRLIGASASLGDPWGIARIHGGVFNTAKEAHEQLFSTESLMYAGRLELAVDRIFDVAGINTGRFFNMSLGGSIAYSKNNYDPRTEMRYLGLDARLDLYIFTMEGEVLFKDYYGEGTQENNAYRGMGWHFDFTARVWPTVIDLTFRIEEADNNNELVIDFADTAGMAMDQNKMWMTFGLMIHAARQFDLSFNYVLRREAEGREFVNDMFLGMAQFHL